MLHIINKIIHSDLLAKIIYSKRIVRLFNSITTNKRLLARIYILMDSITSIENMKKFQEECFLFQI